MTNPMNRRTALTTMAAGYAAMQVPLPIGEAKAAVPADLSPNDQRIWQLYQRWVEIDAARDELGARSEAIEATLPIDLRRDAMKADLDAMVEAGQAGADEARITELRQAYFGKSDRARKLRNEAGQEAIDDQKERLGSEKIRIEQELSEIPPDTPQGAVPLLRILDDYREIDPVNTLDDQALLDMAFNTLALVRQQAGEA